MPSTSTTIPRISVVMCTYNGATYLAEQMESLLHQSLLPYEIIIQDDGSKDQTAKIAGEYATRYDFIHFYQHTGTPGINRNFFSAMHRSSFIV